MKQLLLMMFFIGFHLSTAGQKLTFRRDSEGIWLMENEKPRYFYQIATRSLNGTYPRANYIHPLYGNQDEILTEDFPEDHLHHRGIFWTWHQLYLRGERIADPWFCDGIKWKVNNINTSVNNGEAILKTNVLWLAAKKNDLPVLKEQASISFKRFDENTFSLTFEITLEALEEEVMLGGSEDEKGYGGFSTRFKLPDDISFVFEGKTVLPKNTAIKEGPWISLTGSFNGSEKSGIVIMGEPDKLPSYQGWILRNSKSMQNMAFPGSSAIPLKKGQPMSFRNEILIFKSLNDQQIKNYYLLFEGKRNN